MSDLYRKIYQANILQEAFQRVAENHGCSGSDGVSIASFRRQLSANLRSLADDLAGERYHPYPLLRIQIPKNNRPGWRYLSVPTVRDRVAHLDAGLDRRFSGHPSGV